MKKPDAVDAALTPLLSAQEVMVILGVSRAFCTKHAAELGAIRVGSLLHFERAGIDAYLARQRVAPPVEAPQRQVRRPVDIRAHRGPINRVTGKPWADPAPAACSTGGRP